MNNKKFTKAEVLELVKAEMNNFKTHTKEEVKAEAIGFIRAFMKVGILTQEEAADIAIELL